MIFHQSILMYFFINLKCRFTFYSETEKCRGAAARVKSILCEIRDRFGSEAGVEKQRPPASYLVGYGHSVLAGSIAQEVVFWPDMGQQCSEPRHR